MADYKITRELVKWLRLHSVPYRIESRNIFIAGSVSQVQNGEIITYFPGYEKKIISMVHQYRGPEYFYKRLLAVISALKPLRQYNALPLFIEMKNEQ